MLWIAIVLLCGTVKQLDATCQATGSHKASPSPEPELHDCPLYAKNACCSVDTNNKMSISPETASWNRCGPLSPRCEQFFKQLSCFYHCSPDTTIWANPTLSNHLLNVPLCHSFCDQWYKACKNDLTCTRNWNSGLKSSNATQTNCTSECIPYSKMYRNGRDLCESTDGDSFKVRSCNCLNMDKNDEQVIKALTLEDSTKVGANGKLPCREKRSIMNKLKLSIRKRSLFVEDIDGSGSGFAPTD
ncbi:riboflavin-binding protein-like [Pristis pectinata]|uniref:riboflavin-binding protein-like n=1 Tax=Pristis pectinata TaxID=685728 RepID=UPI00223E4FC7|nr:riboflavin-binding protein-like [Pristis pectinata]